MIDGDIKRISKHEDQLRNWFVFGSSSDGKVDLNDGHSDVATNLTQIQAAQIIALRNAFVNAVEAVITDDYI